MNDSVIGTSGPNAQNPSVSGTVTEQEKTAASKDGRVDKQDTGLLKDKTFQAIYNAFQLGWSLYELKSRVLLASFDVELQAPPRSQQPQPDNQDPLQAFVDDLFKQAQPVNAPPQPSDDPSLADNDKPVLPEAASENDWLRSVWRALFKQIADLHNKCSLEEAGEDDAANSKLYNYLSTEQAKKLYPYLYFQDQNIEYPKLGMPTTVDENKFGLPSLVYRALNCLTLLYTDPEKTLSPETVKKYQQALLKAIPNSNPSVNEPDSKKLLSGFAIKLLVTWDNYVREHIYNGGIIKNDEIELVAYEAGRSLASLPWGISVRTVVLEKMLSSKSASATADTAEQAKEQLYDVWQEVFDKRNIVHIQHQISALGQTMDDAYYNVIPGAHRPDVEKNKDTVVDDTHLPTRSIHAIRHSLDYWLRAIIWLGKPEVQQAIRTRDEYTGTSKQSILTGDLAHDLRIALIHQSDMWHSLMTYEQNLSNFTAESVTLNILNDFMVKFEQAMSKRFSMLPLVVGIGVCALLFIVIIFVLPLFTNSPIAQSLDKPPAIIVLIGTILAGGTHAVMNWLSKMRGIFGTSGQAISDALQKGYAQLLVEFGDLNYNVAVSSALTAFFIEDVVWFWKGPSSLQIVVNDAYSFLTEIVWTEQERAEEIERVANAAFGPLGAFIGTELRTSGRSKK